MSLEVALFAESGFTFLRRRKPEPVSMIIEPCFVYRPNHVMLFDSEEPEIESNKDWVEGGTSTVTYIRPAALGTFFPRGVSFSVKVFSARRKFSQTVRLFSIFYFSSEPQA